MESRLGDYAEGVNLAGAGAVAVAVDGGGLVFWTKVFDKIHRYRGHPAEDVAVADA